MEESQTLTIASTWHFEDEGDQEVRKDYKGYAGQGFCKYDSTHDAFVVENCDAILSAALFGRLVKSFIEDNAFEGDNKHNDLLENPKITRIAVAAEPIEEGINAESEPDDALIDMTSLVPVTSLATPLTIEYWSCDTTGGGTGCFTGLSFDILGNIAKVSGAEISPDGENKRIRVSSFDASQVERALGYLNELEKPLSLITSPHVTHVLNVGNTRHFLIKFPTYMSLNKLALRRVLVDPESRLCNRVFKMFVAVLMLKKLEAKDPELPENLRIPPRLAEKRKGSSKLWEGFKFQELGNSANLPHLETTVTAYTATGRELGKLESNFIPGLISGLINTHPYLSKEKATHVDRWVEDGLEAGAIGVDGPQPNEMPPPEPSAELPESMKMVPGIKTRRVAGAKESSETAAPAAVIPRKTEPSQDQADNEATAAQASPCVPASFNPTAYGQAKLSPDRNARPVKPPKKAKKAKPSPKRPKVRISKRLINLDGNTVRPPGSTPKPHSQRRPAHKASNNTKQNQDLTDQGNIASYEDHIDRLKQDNSGDVQSECLETTTNLPVRERMGNDETPTGSDSAACDAKERKQEVSELDTRVFHRVMGQQAPKSSGSRKKAKEEQEAKRRAVLDDAWGNSSTAATTAPKSPKPPEKSTWKKAQIAKLNEPTVIFLKDSLLSITPTLEDTRRFPGSISVEVQLGLILMPSLSKERAGALGDETTWRNLFRPKHNMTVPSTMFTNRLTTSGADVDFMLDLVEGEGFRSTRMFSAEPESMCVWYEIYCKTKNGEDVVVRVDELGTTTVNRPDWILGELNAHCAHRTWDMRTTVQGTLEYCRGGDHEVDDAISDVIEKLYVPPNMSTALLYTRVPEGGQLRITNVFMKRYTRHRYLVGDSSTAGTAKSNTSPSKVKENIKGNTDGASTETDIKDTISEDKSLFLQITEVQRLFCSHTLADKSAIRARALSTKDMVDYHRLWYEVSVIGAAVENLLNINIPAEIGDCTNLWSASDLLGFDKTLLEELEASNACETKGTAAAVAEIIPKGLDSGPLGAMLSLAHKVVDKIDGVGWANQGPGVEAAEDAEDALATSYGTQVGRSIPLVIGQGTAVAGPSNVGTRVNDDNNSFGLGLGSVVGAGAGTGAGAVAGGVELEGVEERSVGSFW
ncbi:hypothetical protein AJ80_01570 [Polytolypa hystricis UAMH7299]|uniref:Uncharacterized protein n=1 Tax=Polytolypa hystricis (strain UAMH7299) TaxID=1447883 RepID=A0A2B7YS00_POLH7|nr:hypothetical protein AJ80_01570 [Polytolypa hystricis UAMH7299]